MPLVYKSYQGQQGLSSLWTIINNSQYFINYQLGITVFPHSPVGCEQYIVTCGLSCFQQGNYQVLVTTPATHCSKLFKSIATHIIVDCSMSVSQFWEYLIVLGLEGATTCPSHAQDREVNMGIYDAVRHQQAQCMLQSSSQHGPIGQEPDRSQPMASVRQISMLGWPPPCHGRCSPPSMCKVPCLVQVSNTHSQLSSEKAIGLAHTDMGNQVIVDPINASLGVHKTSGDSGSPIGTPLVLGKAPCLAQTSIGSPLQLNPDKALGFVDGINSLPVCPPSVTGVGDSMLIPDPNLYSVGIPQSYWDEVKEQFLDIQYEIFCISKTLNRLCQREFWDITSVSPDMARDNYLGSNTQVETSPVQGVS